MYINNEVVVIVLTIYQNIARECHNYKQKIVGIGKSAISSTTRSSLTKTILSLLGYRKNYEWYFLSFLINCSI